MRAAGMVTDPLSAARLRRLSKRTTSRSANSSPAFVAFERLREV